MRRLTAAAGLLLLAASPGTPERRALDAFDGQIAGWIAAPSEGVRMALAPDAGALRIDFDFQGRAGWAAARKAFPVTLPDNWAIRFRFRGEGPPQTLEFKLLEPGGENVWWSVRRDFPLPADWTTLTVRKRQVSFAWGPAGPGRELRELGAIEVTVVNASGGRGSVWIDDLVFEELPPPGAPLPSRKDWTSAPAAGEPAELILDLGGRRELGGFALLWDAADFATRYDFELSDDGRTWSRARTVSSPRGGRVRIYLPDAEAAFARLRLHESSRGRGYALREISVEPPESADTPTKFLETLAREAPSGQWPRSFKGEQIYWTLVGTDGGGRENGLLSEDGSLEAGPAGFSLEPFLRSGDTLLGWREATSTHRLEEDALPIPSVQRRYPGGVALNVTALADGPPEASTLRARYRLGNSGTSAVRVTLYVALRPMQVNPPSQFLNVPGGFSPIRSVAWDGRTAEVNGSRRVVPLSLPSAFGASPLEEGEIVSRLSEKDFPSAAQAADADGFASAAFAWDLEIPAGGSRDVYLAVPLAAAPLPGRPEAAQGGADFQARLDAAARSWSKKLDRVTFALPGPARDLADTARANLAWILANRDGPAIRPGSRAYARSWIRDGSLTSVALLRLGHFDEVRDFLRWFAPFQYENGAVPCCVDRRGADPVPEHDSHGELLYLASEYFAYTGDRATVEEVWPRLAKAAAHIDALRARRRTPEYSAGEKRLFFGLLPESISHEGYSSKPVHSYWDDLWAVRGLTGASELARALGKSAEATRITASRDQMRQDLHASVRAVIAARKLDFIPGSADLGDLDPTSTTIAFEPCDEAARLPQPELANTFEKYWTSFVARRKNRRQAPAGTYTPYEWRVAGTYVRLGRRDRAQALFEFFFGDRRPPGWKHWAEVVGADARAPQFIGDMPHGWVGSDFLRSFLDLFVYDRAEDGALVLGAGVPPAWLADPRGVSIGRIRTRYGPLDLAMSADASGVRVRIGGGLTLPPGGFVVPWPLPGRPAAASVNAKAVALPAAGDLVVREVPADIVFERAAP